MLKMLSPLLTLLPLLLLSPKSIWLFLPSFLLILTPLSLFSMYTPLLSQTISLYSFMDPLNIPLMILSLWISALMFLSSKNIFLSNLSYKPFSFWVLLLLIFLMLSFSANNMIMFYIMFESTLIPTLILILGWGYQPERLQASFYFILYTITASLPLLISILTIYSNSGHTFLFMEWFIPKISQNILSMWWILTCIAFMVKLPLFLVHLWLPKAHVEAPVAGSMILAAILLKLGGYGLIRTSLSFLPSYFFPTSLFMSISLWGAIISSIICLRQTDLKALIAYSSVGHMGMLIAGTMSLSTFGFYGAICMMIAHGLSSSALFSIANSTYEATNTRSLYISKGLAMIAPHLALWWFLLSAANMAAPPSINLFSEIILIISIVAFSPHSWIPIAFITFLSAAYSLYLYSASQHGQPPQFLAPLNLYSSNTYTTMILHFLPIIFLTLKPETMLFL